MKRLRILIFGMITAMAMSLVVACGGDDESSSRKIVDGVNVPTGKKLVELRLAYENNSREEVPDVYTVEYDSKGRLSKVMHKKKSYYEYTGEILTAATIDYDLKSVKIYSPTQADKFWSYGFTLNDDGYVSKIGPCTLTYDSNGFLTGVEDTKGFSSLVYDGSDLIKASVSNFSNVNVSMYFVSYENLNNEGDLLINIQRNDEKFSNGSGLDNDNIVTLIAYQSGLFGRVSKTFINLKSRSEMSTLVGYKSSRRNMNGRITFVCE